MFSFPETGADAQRVRRTIRVAIIAGAVGSVIGGGIVITSVATVLAIVNPAEKQAAAPKAAPPASTTPAKTQTVSKDCAEQTWPNIEQRCLTRVENTQTTAEPATTTATLAIAPAAPPAVEPAELQPGSPVMPAPPVLAPQGVAATSETPEISAQTQPAPAAAAPSAEIPTPVAKPAPKAAAPKQPVRKAERPKRAPQTVARSNDDDDDEIVQRAPAATGTQRRVVTRSAVDDDDDIDARPVQRRIVIYPANGDAPRVIPRARTSTFGSLFGDN